MVLLDRYCGFQLHFSQHYCGMLEGSNLAHAEIIVGHGFCS